MITNLTATQLREAADLQDKIAKFQTQLASILGNVTKASPAAVKDSRKNAMSEAGRARIIAAQKLRWAKIHAAKGKPAVKAVKAVGAVKKKRKFSAEGLARIKAAQKARWAKIWAAQKK